MPWMRSVATVSHSAPSASQRPTSSGHSEEYARPWGNWAIWVITSLALPGVRDSQRGFKLFSEDAAEAVFSRCVIDGWGFDVEALALARRFDLPTVEVPVTWRHIDGGTITAMAYLTTLQDVIRIRWRMMRGAYDRAPLVRNP